MIDEHDRLLKIDECERLSADTFFFYKPTWGLILKALNWSFGKTAEEIKTHIEKCVEKQNQSPGILMNQWQLMIDSLKWVIEETEIDPIESRRNLIPLAR